MHWPEDVLTRVWDKVRELIRPRLKARLWAEVHDEFLRNIPYHLTCLVHQWVGDDTFLHSWMRPYSRRRLPPRLRSQCIIDTNVADTQAELVAEAWSRAEEGFVSLSDAAANATELLIVREAMESNDEVVAQAVAAEATEDEDQS